MDIGEKNKLNENLIKSSKIASKIACKTKIYASKRKSKQNLAWSKKWYYNNIEYLMKIG